MALRNGLWFFGSVSSSELLQAVWQMALSLPSATLLGVFEWPVAHI
jgi:hypothetical protein